MKLLPVGGTVNQIEEPVPSPKETYQVLYASGLDKGIDTATDPADLDNGEVVAAPGIINRYGKLKRHDGSTPLDGINYAPDVNPVLAYHYHIAQGLNPAIWRFTPSSVYRRNGIASYTPVTGLALVGGPTDRIQVVSYNFGSTDMIVFANNGKNQLQTINTSSLVGGDLRASNVVSTKFKYITTFYNRIIGANETDGPNPVSVYWSGDGNPTVWDPLVDVSAGSSPIVDNPDESSDFITGIFGLDDAMFVMRQRSLWIATKQPIASNPFYFRCSIPDIGSDCPNSIAVVKGGIAWADNRTRTIWAYVKNDEVPEYYYYNLERIGLKIETTFWQNVSDYTQIYGSYNSRTMDYTLCVPATSGNVVQRWTYNFRTKAWTGPAQLPTTYAYQTAQSDVELSNFSGTTFGGLVGTFGGLTGTFAEMSGSVNSQINTTRLYGWSNGETSYEDPNSGFDYVPGAPAPSPPIFPSYTPVNSSITSKIYAFPSDDIVVGMIRIGIRANTGGVLTLSASKNGRSFVLLKSFTLNPGDQQLVQFKKAFKCRNLQWLLQIGGTGAWGTGQPDVNNLEVINYEIHIYRSGESVNNA